MAYLRVQRPERTWNIVIHVREAYTLGEKTTGDKAGKLRWKW